MTADEGTEADLLQDDASNTAVAGSGAAGAGPGEGKRKDPCSLTVVGQAGSSTHAAKRRKH